MHDLCPCCTEALTRDESYPARKQGLPRRISVSLGRQAQTTRQVDAARRASPPFACTPLDLRTGPTMHEPCPTCGHGKAEHDFAPEGCGRSWLDIAGNRKRCGCMEWDPLCTAIESDEEQPDAAVTVLPRPA